MSAIRDILVGDSASITNGHAPAFDISEPPRKRPRVNQACETCRERKTRCDGHQPVCKACEKRGVGASCSYIRQKRASVNNNHHHHNSTSPSNHNNIQHLSPARSADARPFDGTGFAAINHRFVDTPPRKNEEELQRNPPLASIGQADLASVDRPSSVTALFRSISDDHGQPNGARQLPQWRSTSTYPHRTTTAGFEPERLSKSSGTVPHVLPRRRDADNYVQCYWDDMHLIYPLLHKPTFMQAYEKLWLSEDHSVQSEFDENMFMATLNMVFAIGSRLSQQVPNEHKRATADDFYQRSRKFFCYDVLDAESEPIIQLLLLTVIHLQSTRLASRSWNTLGLAIRAAQTIGLHESPSIETSQLQREMRRRIWYTCVTLEKIGAYTFNKPSTVHEIDLPLPSLIDDEYLEGTGKGAQPAHKSSYLLGFIYICRVIAESADYLFPATRFSTKVSTIDKNAQRRLLDQAISAGRCIHDLEQNSPEQFRAESASTSIRLQRSLISIRLLTLRFLAGRPVLFHLAQQSASNAADRSIDQELLVNLGVEAVLDAQNLLTMLHRHRAEAAVVDVCHPSHLTVIIAVALLAAFKSPRNLIDDAGLQHFWDLAIRILEHNEEQVSPTAEAIQLLHALKVHILSKKNGSVNNVDRELHLKGATSVPLDGMNHFTARVRGPDHAIELLDLRNRESASSISLLHCFRDLSWLDPPVEIH